MRETRAAFAMLAPSSISLNAISRLLGFGAVRFAREALIITRKINDFQHISTEMVPKEAIMRFE